MGNIAIFVWVVLGGLAFAFALAAARLGARRRKEEAKKSAKV